MVLTESRAKLLADYLNADAERAQKLAELTPEAALTHVNADGNDFTIEEMREFAQEIQSLALAQSNQGELDENALCDVAGGVGLAAAAAKGAIAVTALITMKKKFTCTW